MSVLDLGNQILDCIVDVAGGGTDTGPGKNSHSSGFLGSGGAVGEGQGGSGEGDTAISVLKLLHCRGINCGLFSIVQVRERCSH